MRRNIYCILYVPILYILGLSIPSSGLYSLCSIQNEWLYQITLILLYFMDNVGGILNIFLSSLSFYFFPLPIFFSFGNYYHCPAPNPPLTIRSNVSNLSFSRVPLSHFVHASDKQSGPLHIIISSEPMIRYEQFLDPITCCHLSSVSLWGSSRKSVLVGSVIDLWVSL